MWIPQSMFGLQASGSAGTNCAGARHGCWGPLTEHQLSACQGNGSAFAGTSAPALVGAKAHACMFNYKLHKNINILLDSFNNMKKLTNKTHLIPHTC